MKFTILIIDDEKNIREGLGAAFEMEGYEVRLAEKKGSIVSQRATSIWLSPISAWMVFQAKKCSAA